jgi:hypothetical protein
MPTSKKSTTPSVPPVTNRSAAIRNANKAKAVVPDARDVAIGLAAPPSSTSHHSIDVNRAPEAGQALQLREQAVAIVVKDRESHAAALEFVRGAKQLQRKIVEHWQRITRSIDDLKRNMLKLKDQDLEPVEAAIKIVEGAVIRYQDAEKERVRLLEEANRLERERLAREERQRELDAAEDRALELEQQSEGLSARELWFVEKVYSNGLELANPTATDLRAMIRIATDAGYKKNVDVEVARLLRSKKILQAIQAKREAAAIREQAEAKRQQPVHIIDAPPVEAQVAQGRGLPTTRTYYSAEVFDANQLREAFLNGKVDPQALIPNEVYLNAQARAAKSAEIFERAFPGVRLKSRQGLAG